MCGRYALSAHREELDDAYPVHVILAEHHPRWNIAPTQDAPILLNDGRERRIVAFRWGLVPHWAKGPSLGPRMINARAESAATKPVFRGAFQDGRRCLVLTDGFYEWRKPASGTGPKTPFWIGMSDGRPFALAGLWERWGPRDAPLRTFAVLTTEPNALVAPIHDRMPVILPRAAWERWVDPDVHSRELTELLGPYPAGEMASREVSTFVNDPRHEGPECVRPA